MRETEVSRTALATAFLRAAHQVLDGDSLLLDDPIAVTLLAQEAQQWIHKPDERSNSPAARALRCHVVLRSRYAEDRLAAAVMHGVTQYILVGAGFDTFALRQPAWANALKIIEVDHPATQRVKKERIADAGLTVPSNLIFADIDFEKESLLEGLNRHTVSTLLPTFFSWLGVSMYLTEPAIDLTLKSIAQFPKGSELVMTFAQPRETYSGLASVVTAEMSRRVAELGEPFVSFFEPAAIEKKLLNAGFGSVEFLTPELAKEKYFTLKTISLPPPARTNILAAIR